MFQCDQQNATEESKVVQLTGQSESKSDFAVLNLCSDNTNFWSKSLVFARNYRNSLNLLMRWDGMGYIGVSGISSRALLHPWLTDSQIHGFSKHLINLSLQPNTTSNKTSIPTSDGLLFRSLFQFSFHSKHIFFFHLLFPFSFHGLAKKIPFHFLFLFSFHGLASANCPSVPAVYTRVSSSPDKTVSSETNNKHSFDIEIYSSQIANKYSFD